jgi:phosphoribosylaminoimidazole carboxylase PurE protein
MNEKKVLILMGSDSDLPAMRKVSESLGKFDISYDMHVASAHRSPARVEAFTKTAREKGYKVVIAGAGMAAHLAGVIASHTTLPVIGVPLAAGTLGGTDAMLATLQMPPGIPVATVGIGPAGGTNAGLLAAAILSISDSDLARKLDTYRLGLAKKVEEKDAKLQEQI